MRRLGLRTHWAVASVLLPAYALTAGAALWLQARSHAALEASFERDLIASAQLPRLRDDAGRLAQLTAQYLLSGDRRQLTSRRKVLEDLRRLEAGLARSAEGAEEGALLDRLGRELAAMTSEQEQWIARRAQGRLGRGPAARLSAQGDGVADVVAVLLRLKDANRQRLAERRRQVERSGRSALGALLAAGAAVGLLAAFYLSRFLVEPLLRLQDYAKAWRLGSPWSLEPGTAGAEVAELHDRLAEMAGRLSIQYEKEQELGKVKTQLVAMVSHEFNNSLSVLGGMAKLLKEEEPQPLSPRRLNFFTIIEANVRSLAVASRTLLELGRLEAGRLTVRQVRMDLGALARDCAGRLEVLWSRKSQAVAVSASDAPVWVSGDPDALALVVTNLLANAIKYTPEKGSITLAVRPTAAGAEFTVADNGIGIALEEQESILAGYYRTEEGTKRAKGFGVGLALSVALLRAHGAELKVESSPGQGARFSFFLPAHPSPHPSA